MLVDIIAFIFLIILAVSIAYFGFRVSGIHNFKDIVDVLKGNG